MAPDPRAPLFRYRRHAETLNEMSLGFGDDLIVLMPVYNDWKALSLLLPRLDRALASSDFKARVVVVDDGSTATTPAALGQSPGRRPGRAACVHIG